jgi:hypothetical protein
MPIPMMPTRLFIRRSGAALAVLLVASLCPTAGATNESPLARYFSHWSERVEAAKASQPGWITPLATTTPRLEQEFRYDQNHQSLWNGGTVDVYDSGKGLELIPTEHTEIILTTPPYQVRRGENAASGFNDWPGILLKYRLLSANERSGDYVVTLFAQYGLPVGARVYTNHNHVFTPTLAAGKGSGAFDLQATLGESIPTHDHSRTGCALLTNLTAQYHASTLLWPELELNRTDWIGGARDGRSQTYLTTGLVLGRFAVGDRSKLILGAGYQRPLSRHSGGSPVTPTFNHNWIFSARTTF